LKPTLIVGENVDDKPGSTTPYEVGTGTGTITGGAAGDILVGDVGGSSMQNQNKDYNVVMMLDVSGSMSGEKIAELRDAVKNLLADLNNYQGGTVTIHMVPFGSHVYNNTWGTFTLQPGSTADDYQNALNYVNALRSYTGDAQYTNYEAPLQKANEWLANDAPKGVDNYAYFVSDGEPNRYLNGQGQSTNGNSSTVMGQITGSDGSNEVAILKGQTVEVIGVGIGVNNSTLNNISVISDDPAIDVQDPSDLKQALTGASPLNQLANVGNDVLTGGDGSDIIYGDSVNTDALAIAKGLDMAAGSGWDVFAKLESGSNWTRADTIKYIQDHAEELAHESVGSGNSTRAGGNDTIYGGAGNDIIFGQEGNDIIYGDAGNDHIYGGSGNDTLYGGSGADTFHYTGNDGHDTIKDFNIAEGDVLDLSELLGDINGFTQAAINDFVFATTQNGNTVISVDVTGSGNVANAQAIATLQGVATTDLNDLLNAHTLQTNV
jgi:Ca2+-binding RTX toxin-like protein